MADEFIRNSITCCNTERRFIMNQQQDPSADDMLVREAEMVADHYLNENLKINLAIKARLVIAIMFPDPGVAQRLVKELDVSLEEAQVMFLDAKLFLWACSLGKGMCPTKAIDEAWHNFILFTKDYHKFCKQIAGEYLHHVPHVGDNKPSEEESKALYDKTQENIFKLFNINHLSDNWKLYTMAQCACGQNCGQVDCCAVAPSNKEEILDYMRRDDPGFMSGGCYASLEEMPLPELKPPVPPTGGGCSFKGRQERIRQLIGRPVAKTPALMKLQGIGDCSFAPACECGDDH